MRNLRGVVMLPMLVMPAREDAVLALPQATAPALAVAAMAVMAAAFRAMVAAMPNAVDPLSHAAILATLAIRKAARHLMVSPEMRHQHRASQVPSRAIATLTTSSPQATPRPASRHPDSPLATAIISEVDPALAAVARAALGVEATAPAGRVVLARLAAVKTWSGSWPTD